MLPCNVLDLRPRGKGRTLAWQGAGHENTKGTAQLPSFFVNVDELGHVGKVSIQTYVLRRCMLEGTRMRIYDSNVLLHEKDEEIQHSQHADQWLGKIQGSTFGPSALEWTFGSVGRSNAVQTEVEDER